MRKVMIEELNGVFVVSCFENGTFMFEKEFETEKHVEYFVIGYTASNWKQTTCRSSLSIH